MVIPQDPVVEEPKYLGDDVVGILSNGVLLDSHRQTWAYDMCNGHSDKKHQYHYHIPPICFLESMGLEFADSASWWINDEGDAVRVYEEMADQFPATGPASPVIGFARDGHPIFGPYDDLGNLQRGATYGGDLDECNGKMDSNGKYGYYMTVDPPFAPPCLKGEIGLFTYAPPSALSCPKAGITNTIVAPFGEAAVSKSESITTSRAGEEQSDKEEKMDAEDSQLDAGMEELEAELSSGTLALGLRLFGAFVAGVLALVM